MNLKLNPQFWKFICLNYQYLSITKVIYVYRDQPKSMLNLNPNQDQINYFIKSQLKDWED